MEILKRALSHYVVRRRVRGKKCRCGIHIPWSRLRNCMIPEANCMFHDGTYSSQLQNDPLQTSTPEEFQRLLKTREKYYRTRADYLFGIAQKRGEPFLKILFNTYFYRQLMKPVPTDQNNQCRMIAQGHNFIECLRAGFAEAANILRTWPSVQALLKAGIPYYKVGINGIVHPMLRDEFRKPEMAPTLKRYVIDHFISYKCPCKECNPCPYKTLALNYAPTLCKYHLALMAFWVHVKGKIHAWKTTHGFRAQQPFVSNTDTMVQLIQRNPHRVPNAKEEFVRAMIQEPDRITESYVYTAPWKNWLKWLGAEGHTVVQKDVVTIYMRSNAGLELANLFAEHQTYSLSNSFLLAAANALKTYPIEYEDAELIYTQLLDTLYELYNIHTGVVCKMLEVLGRFSMYFYSYNHNLFFTILRSASLGDYMEKDIFVMKTIVQHCILDKECIDLIKYGIVYRNRELLVKSPLFQTRYNSILDRWCYTPLAKFFQKAMQIMRIRKQIRMRTMCLLEPYTHAWQTFVIRFRYKMSALLKKKECPICFETSTEKIILHNDRRHFTCLKCYERLSTKCPFCRTDLFKSSHTTRNYDDYDEYEYYDEYDDYDRRYDEYDDYYRGRDELRDLVLGRSRYR